jgi:hypothetical protein
LPGGSDIPAILRYLQRSFKARKWDCLQHKRGRYCRLAAPGKFHAELKNSRASIGLSGKLSPGFGSTWGASIQAGQFDCGQQGMRVIFFRPHVRAVIYVEQWAAIRDT